MIIAYKELEVFVVGYAGGFVKDEACPIFTIFGQGWSLRIWANPPENS